MKIAAICLLRKDIMAHLNLTGDVIIDCIDVLTLKDQLHDEKNYNRCDLIGLFLKVLGDNFSYKSSQNI